MHLPCLRGRRLRSFAGPIAARSYDPRVAESVWDRVLGHVFEVAVAAGALVLGGAYLLARSELLPPVGSVTARYTWNLLATAGGAAVLYSLLRVNHENVRAAGLMLLSAAFALQAAALVGHGESSLVVVYVIYAVACALRACVVVRLLLRRRA